MFECVSPGCGLDVPGEWGRGIFRLFSHVQLCLSRAFLTLVIEKPHSREAERKVGGLLRLLMCENRAAIASKISALSFRGVESSLFFLVFLVFFSDSPLTCTEVCSFL